MPRFQVERSWVLKRTVDKNWAKTRRWEEQLGQHRSLYHKEPVFCLKSSVWNKNTKRGKEFRHLPIDGSAIEKVAGCRIRPEVAVGSLSAQAKHVVPPGVSKLVTLSLEKEKALTCALTSNSQKASTIL